MQYKLQGLKKSSNLCAINICQTPQEQKRGMSNCKIKLPKACSVQNQKESCDPRH